MSVSSCELGDKQGMLYTSQVSILLRTRDIREFTTGYMNYKHTVYCVRLLIHHKHFWNMKVFNAQMIYTFLTSFCCENTSLNH